MLKKLNGKAIVFITNILTLMPLCVVSYNYDQYNSNGKLIYVPIAITGILAMIFVISTPVYFGKIILTTVIGFLLTIVIKSQIDEFVGLGEHNLIGLEIIFGGFYAFIAAAAGATFGFFYKKYFLVSDKRD